MGYTDFVNAKLFGILTTLTFPAEITFGRDTAQFELLVEFLAWLSLTLWGIVFFTTLLRTHSHYKHAWHKRKSRKKMEGKPHGYS
jgi:hypothetical protein